MLLRNCCSLSLLTLAILVLVTASMSEEERVDPVASVGG